MRLPDVNVLAHAFRTDVAQQRFRGPRGPDGSSIPRLR